MNITWIIGNGFDASLGLQTDYRSFLDNCYLPGSDKEGYRRHLIEVMPESPFDKNARYWSDLEMLIGTASRYYNKNEEELFTATFEDIEDKFLDYLQEEEIRSTVELTAEYIEEFKKSIGSFNRTMPDLEKNVFGITNIAGHIYHHIISLNYTNMLDRIFDSLPNDKIIKEHSAGGYVYHDSIAEVMHVHGSLGSNGNSEQDIVFGIDSIDQIQNESFADDADFIERWVKKNQNTSLYQNNNEELLQFQICQADIICVYGCSMGLSDSRIWQMIARRMISQSQVQLVLYCYNYPNRHTRHSRMFQKARESCRNKFKIAASMSDEEFETIKRRIHIVRAQDIFRMHDSN